MSEHVDGGPLVCGDGMRATLEAYLQQQRGDDVTLADLSRIATGNSRSNWRATMSDGDRYVVRIEQGGVFGTSSADEFAFMKAAGQLGCPVAPVRWIEPTGNVLGQPFFVMDFIDGVSTGRDDRSMTPAIADNFVRRLNELHHTDWASVITGALATDTGPERVTHAQIDRWYDVYRTESPVPLPLMEEGAAWLHANVTAPELVGIVHGDPGPGNFVHDGAQVVAMTDWEFTHLGDPMEDWVYLISMRGSRTMAPDEWVALFERVAGVSPTARDLRFWKVFNYFKGACANLTCRRVFTTGYPAPNMGLIGTALQQTFMRQMAELVGE